MSVIIFDMDGTILNTIDDIAGAVNYILEKYQFPLRSVEEVKFFVGNGLKRTLELSLPEGTAPSFIDEIYEEFVSYYKTHCHIATKPYDGIVETIDTLKQAGYQLAVVSNKRQEAVEDLCKEFYPGLFDIQMGDQDGMQRKPAPDMVSYVLEKLSANTSQALYIGDSDVDVKTARNAKLTGIFVTWGFRSRDFLVQQGAHHIVDTPQELLTRIQEITSLHN